MKSGSNLAWLLAIVVAGGIMPGSAAAQHDPLASVKRFSAPSRYLHMVSSPIPRQHIERYGQILSLSEAQRHYVDSIYEKYREDCQAIDRRHAPGLLALGEAAAKAQGSLFHHWRTILEVKQAEDALMDEQTPLDELFFAEISAILADEQLAAMERVRLHRKRHNFPKIFYQFLPKATIDLSELIEESNIPREITLELEDLMAEYERAVTPHFIQTERKFRDSCRTLVEIDLAGWFGPNGEPLNPRDNPAMQDAVRELSARSRAIRRDLGLSKQQIARINDEFLPRFIEKLPERMGKAVESAYLRKAYNRAFPDPADPLRMYEAIIESQALPPQTRETLEAIWMHYRASYNKINQAMCKAQDEWAESVTFLGGFDKEPEYEEKFKAWTRQRVKLTRDLWSTMKPLLSKEVLNEKTSLVGEWEAQLQRTEKFVARLPDLRYWVYE